MRAEQSEPEVLNVYEAQESKEWIPPAYTVRKMGLILRSIEQMLKMQFSMARMFTFKPLRRYDVKPPQA
jgi:hypothetical protein